VAILRPEKFLVSRLEKRLEKQLGRGSGMRLKKKACELIRVAEAIGEEFSAPPLATKEMINDILRTKLRSQLTDVSKSRRLLVTLKNLKGKG
jgi:hypothetical protein